MEISEFLNDQYGDAALYLNYRAIPSYIDGLKNSGRKTVYTARKDNIRNKMKVSAFGSAVIKRANYLHGESSIQGTIITLSKSYCGSNNLPILKGDGAFGTRHTPEAAAPRYIFSSMSNYFDLLFRKEDDVNLKFQEFEGEEIEPMFYVPTLPLLLINGSVGIGVGFASLILNRSLKNIIKAVELALEDKEIDDSLFNPMWNNFNGEIKPLGNNKWEIRGKAEFKKNKVIIKEVPISWNLLDYLAELKKLKEEGFITKFIDNSEDDRFDFEITLSPSACLKTEEEILDTLGLIKTETENLTCIDENNAIKEFDSVKDIFYNYFNIKLKSLEARKQSELSKMNKEEKYLQELLRFIHDVGMNKINIRTKKSDLEKQLTEKKYTYIDKLVSIPVYYICEDKEKEIQNKLDEKVKEIAACCDETPKTLWRKDLEELKKHI